MEEIFVKVLDPENIDQPMFEQPETDDSLLTLYRLMAFTRAFDARMIGLQRQGRISAYGSSEGEEAVAVGAASVVGSSDWLCADYRVPGALFTRGVSLVSYVAQLLGTNLDPTKGRQLPTHYANRELRIPSISSPIGNGILHAVGIAWGSKITKGGETALCFFGDGATSEDGFHAGMNFAGVHQLPVVFVCRNNQYAISVPLKLQTASKTIAIKAQAYGFEGIRVDGSDVLAVRAVTREALDRARRGDGPTLIEAVCYRFGAHSTSDDPRMYRDQAEVDEWRSRDCLKRFRDQIERQGLWNEEREARMQEEFKSEISRAVVEAESAGEPAITTLFEDVYEQMPWHLREQQDGLLAHLRTRSEGSK